MLKLYRFLRIRFNADRYLAGFLALWANMIAWFFVGCLLGSLVIFLTGQRNHINIVFDVGALFCLVAGYVIGLIRVMFAE